MANHCTCDSWFTTDQCKLSGGSNMSTQNHQESLNSLRLCFKCKISILCRETQLCQIWCKQVSSLPSTALQGRSQPLGYPSVSSTRLLVCSKPCAVPLGTKEKPVLSSSLNPALLSQEFPNLFAHCPALWEAASNTYFLGCRHTIVFPE